MLLFPIFGRQDSLVNRSLAYDTCSLINLFSTVDQVLEIFSIASGGSIIQVLEDASHKLVFSNLKGILSSGSACSISPKLREESGLLEVTIVGRDVKGSVMVLILAVENLFQQKFDLMLELFDDHVVVLLAQKVLEFSEHIFVLSWVELGVLFVLKLLQGEEQLVEFLGSWHVIDLDVEQGLSCLEALGLLAHGTVVNGVPSVLVLDSQHLSVPVNDVLRVLLEQVEHSLVELLVPLDRVRVVENLAAQVAVLDVHVLEPVLVFVSNQLVVKSLLEVHSLDVEENDGAVVVAAIAHAVVGVSVLDVDVDLLVDHICWGAHFGEKVQSDVFEA